MRSGKPYSNVTFTKRVDHDGGCHRPPRAPAEPRVCTACGAAWFRRRWIAPTDPRASLLATAGHALRVVCPACRLAASGSPRGYLSVGGRFYSAHQEEIDRLIAAEAARALIDNPTGRIMGWTHTAGNALEVTTTTEHLADRLGHALHRAFRGSVHYDFGHENHLVRVTWRRD